MAMPKTSNWNWFRDIFKNQKQGLLKGAGKGAFRILKAAREDPFGLTLRGNMEVEGNGPEDLTWDHNDIVQYAVYKSYFGADLEAGLWWSSGLERHTISGRFLVYPQRSRVRIPPRRA